MHCSQSPLHRNYQFGLIGLVGEKRVAWQAAPSRQPLTVMGPC